MQEEQALLTEEIRKLIGSPRKTITDLPAQATDIARYCEATGETNPLFTDVGYARGTPYGGPIAPPAFYLAAYMLAPGAFKPVPPGATIEELQEIADLLPVKRPLDARLKVEFKAPIRPEDVLTRESRIADIVERETKVGRGLFVTIENTIINQQGQEICREIQEFLFY
ncbi:MAG: hypothetical protein EPO21_17180 [Chloroflexota bacterium]|nr:MAG: hypothetical protein EPO21_17180 [Chloroflexota bacterium]